MRLNMNKYNKSRKIHLPCTKCYFKAKIDCICLQSFSIVEASPNSNLDRLITIYHFQQPHRNSPLQHRIGANSVKCSLAISSTTEDASQDWMIPFKTRRHVTSMTYIILNNQSVALLLPANYCIVLDQKAFTSHLFACPIRTYLHKCAVDSEYYNK